MIKKTRIKKLLNCLQEQLYVILSKYNYDQNSVDCQKMNDDDYKLYIVLDKNIQLYREILQSTENVVLYENRNN